MCGIDPKRPATGQRSQVKSFSLTGLVPLVLEERRSRIDSIPITQFTVLHIPDHIQRALLESA